jgi:hypothetical protein
VHDALTRLQSTPTGGSITVRAYVVDSEGSRAVVEGSLEAGGEGVIIAMEHPSVVP